MFPWFFYLLACLLFCYILGSIFSKLKLNFILLVFIFLSTPAVTMTEGEIPSPLIYKFVFDFLFEGNFRTATLRPLLFSLPVGFLLFYLLRLIKRRFFAFLNF